MKLNKTLKFLITLNAIISFVVVVVRLSGGTFMDPVEDAKAISNPTKYMAKDILTVDSVTYNIDEGKTTTDTFKFRIHLTSKKGEKKEIYYYQERYKINLFKQNGKDKMILLRNKINDNVFLDDENYIAYMSRSNYMTMYFYFSLLLTIILTSTTRIYSTISAKSR